VSPPTSHSRSSRPGIVDPASYTPGFSYRGSQLYCEDVSVAAAAKRFGTPAYLYSRASIEQAYCIMDSAFGKLPHTICYAIKANSNLGILRVFAALGSGFDIVSGGELYRLQRIGVPGKRIVFSGVGKSREEIREGLRARILLFNVESPAELDLLASEASRQRVRAVASIRVNPTSRREAILTFPRDIIATNSESIGRPREASIFSTRIRAGLTGRGLARISDRRF